MSVSARLQHAITVLFVAVLVGGCGDGPSAPVVGKLEILSGDAQIASAGAMLPEPLTVRVTDISGRPLGGVTVTWIAGDEDNGGSVSRATTVTGADGTAAIQRTLGRGAGEQVTSARAEENLVRFTSVVQIQGATNIGLAAGNQQVDTVLTTLRPFRVRVVDQSEAPVSGVIVGWSGGWLSSEVTETDADGIAEVTLTLGSAAGTQIVQATVPGLVGSPVSFEATADPGNPAAILAHGGDDQVGMVTRDALPYSVQVADAHGNAIEGVRIHWEVTAGGGTVVPQSDTTAATECGWYDYYCYDGPTNTPIASTTHHLGGDEGDQTVTARAPVLPDLHGVTFTTRAVTAIVGLDGSTFVPADLTVPAGSTVAWVWWSGRHNVTFEDDPTEPVSSSTSSEGRHFRTFDDPGTFGYRCTIHSTSFTQGMVGSVRVQ